MADIQHIRSTIAQTFKLSIERVPPDAAMETLTEWDSVGHVNLMMAIEQEFDIYLEVEDFARLTSVGAIATYLDSVKT